jgi:hypothetical protein
MTLTIIPLPFYGIINYSGCKKPWVILPKRTENGNYFSGDSLARMEERPHSRSRRQKMMPSFLGMHASLGHVIK